jgi:hypothetical protein
MKDENLLQKIEDYFGMADCNTISLTKEEQIEAIFYFRKGPQMNDDNFWDNMCRKLSASEDYRIETLAKIGRFDLLEVMFAKCSDKKNATALISKINKGFALRLKLDYEMKNEHEGCVKKKTKI